MTKIDQWEKDSIVRIQQRANELRAELFERMAIERERRSMKTRQISERLIVSREIEIESYEAVFDKMVNIESDSQ